MNESENNFEALRRLLALKRHEIPPPGYFSNFSGNVIAHIRAGENGSGKSFAGTSWLAKFLQIFEAKPAFAGAFASAMGLILVFGIVFSEQSGDSVPQSLFTQATGNSAPLASISPAILPSLPASTLLDTGVSSNSMSSLQPVASLFGSQNPFAQQVSFTVPGN
jgi:hypothetical protein